MKKRLIYGRKKLDTWDFALIGLNIKWALACKDLRAITRFSLTSVVKCSERQLALSGSICQVFSPIYKGDF